MRIYLDNAATSFPKPETVYFAVEQWQRYSGAAVGRGAYCEAVEGGRIVERCRRRAAELLGAERPDRVVFTFNGTDSLNLALHGLLRAGNHVVTSAIEHNSVLRPLRWLQERVGIEVTHVPADPQGRIEAAAIRAALRPHTRLVALIHASNVAGTLQPIADVADIARRSGALFLVDAAQTAGHLPINVGELGIDLLACPGHKGLLGPLGTGLLYIRPGLEDQIESPRQGGTGSRSEDDRQPTTLPDKYEAGNHNAPGLVGLEAALEFLQQRGIAAVHQHERELTARLLEGLRGIAGLAVHGPSTPADQVGVVSVSLPGWEPQVLAAVLDENFQIQTRAGLHCAPGAHRAIGTFEQGGTVRFSVGPFNTAEQIEAAVAALNEIVRS